MGSRDVTKHPGSPGSDGASPYQAGASRLFPPRDVIPAQISRLSSLVSPVLHRGAATVSDGDSGGTSRDERRGNPPVRSGASPPSLTLPGASPNLRRHSWLQVWRVWWFYQFHGRDWLRDRTDERAFFELIQIMQDMLLDL
jgi:hypothetical protein